MSHIFPAYSFKLTKKCSPAGQITSAPNGIRDNFAILKNCFPKGIPMMVIQHIRPTTAFPTAIGIPDTINHMPWVCNLDAQPLAFR